MPESLFHPDDLNVRNLTVEQPEEQPITLDVAHELRPQDIDTLLDRIKEDEAERWLGDYCIHYDVLHQLDPERAKTVTVSQELRDDLQTTIASALEGKMWNELLRYSTIRAIMPEIQHHRDLNDPAIQEQVAQWLLSVLGISWSINNIEHFRLLFPFYDNPTVLNDFAQALEDAYRKKLLETGTPDTNDLARLRIVAPKRYTAHIPNSSEWHTMLDDFRRQRDKAGPDHVAHLGALQNLAIIAAADVAVTDHGLVITPKKGSTHTDSTLQLPEQREY